MMRGHVHPHSSCSFRCVRPPAARQCRVFSRKPSHTEDRLKHSTVPRAQETVESAGSRVALSLTAAVLTATLLVTPASQAVTDTAAVGSCLLAKCQVQLARCLGDGNCLKNLVCLQKCNDTPDEKACQIRCGDLYDDAAVATFNCCAVSDQKCVPQLSTESAYPEPPKEALVPKFDPADFTGRWYITAGYNKLFDTFDCQEHFFANPEPGKVFGKINWRIPTDDDFIERSTVQRFVQDAENPAILVNSGNEYLHYEDTWYIAAFIPDQYAFIYYKGNNDAWRGYGGATVYTRESKLPEQYIPELQEVAQSVGLKWEDFTLTNNECAAHPPKSGGPFKWLKNLGQKVGTLEKSIENEVLTDLRSFGRGFTVFEKDLVKELSLEEKLIERELADAGKLLKNLESSYGDAKPWFKFW